jgi:ribonuclease HI
VRRAVLYTDGAARGNPGPAGSGAALVDENGHVVAEAMRHLGHATNNVAEYTALIIGLEEARKHDVEDLEVRMDSKLVVEQMNGKWRIRHPNLRPLAIRAGELLAHFPRWRIRHIPRDENAVADLLANRAIDESR